MKRRVLLYLLIFFVLLGSGIIVSHLAYIKRVEEYQNDKLKDFEVQISSVLVSHDDFSEYVFDKVVDNEYVLSRLYLAYKSNDDVKSEVRAELYNYLYGDYELITEYEFRQLHFHFPDTTSFLRMHAPEKYGDILEEDRYSVWYTNETFTKSIGFEEGKIYNGFRYVFPLEYNNEHIGSVEISVSMATVLNHLTTMNSESDFGMVLSKELVQSKVFEDELDNYQEVSFSNEFLSDIQVVDDTIDRNILSSVEIEKLLMETIQIDGEKIAPKFFNGTYNEVRYEIVFIPLVNIQGKEAGYYYGVTESNKALELRNQFIVELVVIVGLGLSLGYLLYIIDKRRELMKEISETDLLTGIYNRRKFNEVLKLEYDRAVRYDSVFSVIMLDLDFFKNVNDHFGHQVGDKVLIELTSLINDNLRLSDTFARFGGEEFVIILPETKLINALQKANQLSKIVENHKFGIINKLTISLGVSCFKKGLSDIEIVKKADEALYKAKTTGRNKVVTNMEL